MGSSRRAWKDPGTAKSPWEGWTGSFGVPGRDTAELRAQVGAGVWVRQVCHGVGWDVGQKEQRRFGFWGRRAAGSLSSRQEVGNRMSWTLLSLFSASQLPPCALCVCVSTEFSPSSLFSPVTASLLPNSLISVPLSSLFPACVSPVCLCSLCPHSLPSLCFFAIQSLLSAPSAPSQLAPVSLCLWSVCSLCIFAPSLPIFLSASVPSLLSRSPISFCSLSLPPPAPGHVSHSYPSVNEGAGAGWQQCGCAGGAACSLEPACTLCCCRGCAGTARGWREDPPSTGGANGAAGPWWVSRWVNSSW